MLASTTSSTLMTRKPAVVEMSHCCVTISMSERKSTCRSAHLRKKNQPVPTAARIINASASAPTLAPVPGITPGPDIMLRIPLATKSPTTAATPASVMPAVNPSERLCARQVRRANSSI